MQSFCTSDNYAAPRFAADRGNRRDCIMGWIWIVIIAAAIVLGLILFHRQMHRKCPHDCASCGRICRYHQFRKGS